MEATIGSFPILMFGLGGGEVIVILVVFLVMFGASRLPELFCGLGTGMREFGKAIRKVREELDQGAFDAGRSAGGIYGKPAAQALTSDNQTAELYDPAVFGRTKRGGKRMAGKSFKAMRSALLIACIALGLIVLVMIVAVLDALVGHFWHQ